MRLSIVIVFLVSLLTGCVSYKAVLPGDLVFEQLQVSTTQAWNEAPSAATPYARQGATTFTQDGLLLDRIMIVPAIPDGEGMFRAGSQDQTLPIFQSDMLPNDIEEFVESSMVRLFGEGQIVVETKNLRPHKFGEVQGMLFDLEVAVSDGPGYSGITGALVSNDKLYLMIFLGAQPYYYDKHRDEARAMIRGARLLTG